MLNASMVESSVNPYGTVSDVIAIGIARNTKRNTGENRINSLDAPTANLPGGDSGRRSSSSTSFSPRPSLIQLFMLAPTFLPPSVNTFLACSDRRFASIAIWTNMGCFLNASAAEDKPLSARSLAHRSRAASDFSFVLFSTTFFTSCLRFLRMPMRTKIVVMYDRLATHAAVSAAPKKDEKGFFEADLVNDLKSVDGDETMSGLLSGDAQAIAGAVGLVANGVTSWSLWVLYNTGCGLPPGPGGSLGALEGVSYLVVTAFVVAATAKKIKTGSGLPAGPGGVLGGAEGISFLVALIGLGVLANQVLHFGYVPNAIPTEGGKCY